MRVVALVSGGKDSCYNMMQCVAAGHEIVALANLKPPQDEIDSYMYQSVGHNVLDLYASAMDLPLFRADIKGKAVNQNFDYLPTEGDEVEDLYNLLVDIKLQGEKIEGLAHSIVEMCHSPEKMKSLDFEAVSVGAIFSDYQRLRVENICKRLDLQMLAYLWHRNQTELLREMIDCKVHAIIIKIAAFGLEIDKHLGMTIEEIYPHMLKMNEKIGLNVCGEGGEFETLTLDCPLFKKRLVIKEKEVVVHSNDAFAPVAYLKLNKVVLEEKEMSDKLTQSDCIKGLPIKLPLCNEEPVIQSECNTCTL